MGCETRRDARPSSPGRPGLVGSHVTRAAGRARRRRARAVRRALARSTTLDDLDVELVDGDVLDRARGAPRDARRRRACSTSPALTSLRASAERDLRASTSTARGSCSRRRCGPASSASCTRRRWPRSARRRAASTADEHQVFRAGRYGLPYVNAKHEAEIEALRAGRARAAGGDRQPGARASAPATATARRPSSCGASCAARSPPTSTARSTSSTPRTSPAATCSPTSAARSGERYILGNRNFTLDRLFADLARLSGVEPPAVKLPLPAALALARGGRAGCPGRPLITTVEVRALVAVVGLPLDEGQARARLAPVATTRTRCETTIDWYREREPARAERARHAPAARAARRRASACARAGGLAAELRRRERHAVPLPHPDRLAVPVRARRARAAPARRRRTRRSGCRGASATARDRGAQRPAPRAAARASRARRSATRGGSSSTWSGAGQRTREQRLGALARRAEDGIEGEEHGAARRRRARRGSPGARPGEPSVQPLSTGP